MRALSLELAVSLGASGSVVADPSGTVIGVAVISVGDTTVAAPLTAGILAENADNRHGFDEWSGGQSARRQAIGLALRANHDTDLRAAWGNAAGAARADPKCAEAWRILGFLAARLARYEEACGFYQEAFKARPFLRDVQPLVAALLRALARRRWGEGQNWIGYQGYLGAMWVDPCDPASGADLGLAAVGVGRFGVAAAAFEHAARLEPQDPEHYRRLGHCLSNLPSGRHAEAVLAYEKAVALRPGDPRMLVDLAQAYWKVGKEGEAVATARRAVEQGAEEPWTHFALANLLAHQGSRDAAIAEFDLGLERAPESIDERVAIIGLLLESGRADEARRHHEILRVWDQRAAAQFDSRLR
jgi:tetratricopeptide (TPR) repeat protein